MTEKPYTDAQLREFEHYLMQNGCSVSTTAQYSAAIKRILRLGSLETAQKGVGLQTSYRMGRANDLWNQFATDPSKYAEGKKRGRSAKEKDLFHQYLLKDGRFSAQTARQYASHLRGILKAGSADLLHSDPSTFANRASVYVYSRTNVPAYMAAWENFRALMRRKRNMELPTLHAVEDGPDVSPDQHLAVWVLWDVGYLTPQAISRMKRESLRWTPCGSHVTFPTSKGEQVGKGCVAWAFSQFGDATTGPLTGLSTKRVKELCASVGGVVEGTPLSTAHKLTRAWSRQKRQPARQG